MLRASALRRAVGAGTPMPACAHAPRPYDGIPYDRALELRKKYVHPTPGTYYGDKAVMCVEGHMQWVWDHTGKRYLDMWGGIVTVGCGHSHPKINAAVKKQMDLIQHTTMLYLHPLQGEYAEAIVSKLPKQHEWLVYFTNSGSESNDLASLLARCYTGSVDYISLRNGYHGMTEAARGFTSARGWKWQPPSFGTKQAMHPSTYRGLFGNRPDATDLYVDDMRALLAETCQPRVAGFIAEPIQGVGGVYEYPEGYLPKMYSVVREHGGVCTADEVQTGWGRLGSHYWGFDYAGCVPDIVVSAKSIGNGWPLGMVAARRPIAEAMTGAAHFNTYGGNPASLAAGLATFRVIEEEGMQENSRLRGEQLIAGLKKLQAAHPIIGDIRGRGLMVGVEYVKDPTTKEPAAAEAMRIQEMMREEGVIVGKAGTFGNVHRFVPPMCVTAEDVEFFLDRFGKSLAAL